MAETLNLANHIPSNIHVSDRTYKAFISLINEEIWKIEISIKVLEKYQHTASLELTK